MNQANDKIDYIEKKMQFYKTKQKKIPGNFSEYLFLT